MGKADVGDNRSAHRACECMVESAGAWKGTKARFTKSLEFDDKSLLLSG